MVIFNKPYKKTIDIENKNREREREEKIKIANRKREICSFIKILELDKKNDREILNEYKFILWADLDMAVKIYLEKRFNIHFYDGYCSSIHSAKLVEPVGRVLETIIKARENKLEVILKEQNND